MVTICYIFDSDVLQCNIEHTSCFYMKENLEFVDTTYLKGMIYNVITFILFLY